jgi:hypothetical protein
VKPLLPLLSAVFLCFPASAQHPAATEWQQSQKTDALRGVSYPQFILTGKWLTPPKHGADTPALVVHCQPGSRSFGHTNGKFIDGYFMAGAVLDAHVTNGNSVTTVEFRLDDKKIQSGFWTPSTDFGGAFFTDVDLDNLLYGHMLQHKEGTGDPVHKIVMAADEYLGGQMVAQFDMPDPTQVAETCGVIFDKK